jgi:hypothetical protein
MGHADPKVSAIYVHTSRSHDRKLASRLNQMAERPEHGNRPPAIPTSDAPG